MSMPAKRIFISYSHDNASHVAKVRRLADGLRANGLDVRLDVYEPQDPPEGWPVWMENQIEQAQNVLVVCTETYHRRVRKEEIPDMGRGVCWEANLIYAELYNSQARSNKFIPIVFDETDRMFVPRPLGTSSVAVVRDNDSFEKLLRRLLGRIGNPAPQIGTVPNLSLPPPLAPFSVTKNWPDTSIVAGQIRPDLRVVGDSTRVPDHRPLLLVLERSLGGGELSDSELGSLVLTTLSEENELGVTQPFEPGWIITGIRLSDMYFALIRPSAGLRDWQRDFAKVATPILVALARSLKPSPDAQATILRICEGLGQRLRLKLLWPSDPDSSNDLRNRIYRTCLNATEVESDEVMMILQTISIVGPH